MSENETTRLIRVHPGVHPNCLNLLPCGITATHWHQKTSAPERTGGYEVVLTSVGSGPLTAIKAVREETGLGLLEARLIVEGVPSLVKSDLTKAAADKLKRRLEEAGMKAEVREQ